MQSLVTRRTCAAAGLIMAAFVSVGCQKADQGETTVLVFGEPPKIADPAAGPLDQGQAVLLSNIGQGLVRFDASGQTAGSSPRSRLRGCSSDRSLRAATIG